MPRPRKPVRTLEELLREAKMIEEAGGKWTVDHVAAVLNLNRKTAYRLRWLRAIREKRGGGTLVAWTPSIVRRHYFLQQPKLVQEMLRREEAAAAKDQRRRA